jgi:uncharacterized protein YqeY
LSIVEDLQARIVVALKAGRKDEVQALRFLLSELQRVEKDGGQKLDDDAEIKVLRKARKSRLEAAEAFRNGGRLELAAKEDTEAALIAELLPKELDQQALSALVDQAIVDAGASSPKDMGAVMALIKQRAGANVDGRTASRLVQERLAQ